MKKNKTYPGRKYSALGSIHWAMTRLWKLDRIYILLMFTSIPLTIALPLVKSWFSKELIDRIGFGASFRELAAVCLIFSSAVLILQLLKDLVHFRGFARQYIPSMVIQSGLRAIRNYGTDYENTENQSFCELYGYAMDDATQGNCSAEFVWEDLTKALTDIFGIFTYGSLLAFMDPRIFLVVAAASLSSYFTARWQPAYWERHKHLWEKEFRKVNYLQDLSENFPMAKDIKLYGLEAWLKKLTEHYQSYVFLWNKRCSLRGAWAGVMAAVMTFLQDGAAYLYLTGLLLNGGITVGEFVFYFSAVGSIAAFLTGIVTDAAALRTRADKIAYLRNVEDYPSRLCHGEGAPLPTGPVEIEFRDVWYKYSGGTDYTIKGLNLTIHPGEHIALVGLNGAGKTTLVKLLCGLYSPTKGKILVGGRDIREYNIEEYYSLISAVFQEVKAVAFTILEFVTSAELSRPTAREDAAQALKCAGLWEKVSSFSAGMDTHLVRGVYDDGVELSGGEMQKLLLARAIYKNGSILVLDEPSAALDPIAENELYLQYRALTRGKTSLYISHRFASTRFCDRILLLENGAITESGTHDELMALGGRYAYMYGVQSRYYKEGNVHD